METKNETITYTPPKLIKSLAAGFNAVANHIGILLFPIVIDLFLWLGPKFGLKELLLPSITSMMELLKTQNSTDMYALFQVAEETWQILLDRFNLAIFIRTYPVGIPSLLSSESPIHTPLGTPERFELSTLSAAILLWGCFGLIGFLAGCAYFYEIARLHNPSLEKITLKKFVQCLIQTVGFSIFLLILLIILSIPFSFILSIFTLLHPVVAQLATFILSLIILWLLLPLLFTPHGIFCRGNNFLTSILASTRMVRMTLPGTGFFILVIILLSQGLDILWRVPPETSWFKLIGIAGHAFISTSVISASFAYYRDGIEWVENFLNAYKQPPSQVI